MKLINKEEVSVDKYILFYYKKSDRLQINVVNTQEISERQEIGFYIATEKQSQ
jgi:hypothetical protein